MFFCTVLVMSDRRVPWVVAAQYRVALEFVALSPSPCIYCAVLVSCRMRGWCKRRRTGDTAPAAAPEDSEAALESWRVSKLELRTLRRLRSAAIERRVTEAAVVLQRALSELVRAWPSIEEELVDADQDVQSNRTEAAHALQLQRQWLSQWHAWAIRRLDSGGGFGPSAVPVARLPSGPS